MLAMKINYSALLACLYLALLSTASCASGPRVFPVLDVQKPVIHTEELACQSHADCVIINAVDGCGCSAGGFDGVANKKYAAEIRERIRSAYHDQHCPTVMNGDPACIGVLPYCHEGQCRLAREE